jgi:cytosine/adenosine deaminase-related metal-dependent hydrolase
MNIIAAGSPSPSRVLVRGGRVLEASGNLHDPRLLDLVIVDGRIVSLDEPEAPSALALDILHHAQASDPDVRVIDARDRLVAPGFINGHYHSYDVLAKGLLENMPFDVWPLMSQPAYWGRRSPQELRVRTLIGAIECLKNGITTVQDMSSLVPQDEETLDTILASYAEVGLRVVFSIAVRDIAALDIAPFVAEDAPEMVNSIVQGQPGDARRDLTFVEAQLRRLSSLPDTQHWALSASGPQRCSNELLEGIADLSQRHDLPIFTHVYETPAQLARARSAYPEDGGSLVRRMKRTGLLGPRTTIAHSVWITREEIGLLAEHGTGVVHNPNANLKLKSGIAPLLDLHEAGVNIALGCDNCSCGDTQNIFQAMKLFTLLAGVMDPLPTPIGAAEAFRAATEGGAQAVGLPREVGALSVGMRADLVLIDLSDIAWQPYNSALRQLVYAENGRGVRTVLVEGRVVMEDGRITGLDEAAFRQEVIEVMKTYRRDFDALHARQAPAFPYLLDANRRLAATRIDSGRFVPRAQPK